MDASIIPGEEDNDIFHDCYEKSEQFYPGFKNQEDLNDPENIKAFINSIDVEEIYEDQVHENQIYEDINLPQIESYLINAVGEK